MTRGSDPLGCNSPKETQGKQLKLWGNREAIYHHVFRHRDATTGRLSADGWFLPDEPAPEPNSRKIRFGPGVHDGIVGHHTETRNAEETAHELHEAYMTPSVPRMASMRGANMALLPNDDGPLRKAAGRLDDLIFLRSAAAGGWAAWLMPLSGFGQVGGMG